MLSIRKLKKTIGGRTLFEEADMQVNYGERVALVEVADQVFQISGGNIVQLPTRAGMGKPVVCN